MGHQVRVSKKELQVDACNLQNVLVPIALKQVRTLEFKEDFDNLSVGVQTGGTRD